jgi:hypothetical protein
MRSDIFANVICSLKRLTKIHTNIYMSFQRKEFVCEFVFEIQEWTYNSTMIIVHLESHKAVTIDLQFM